MADLARRSWANIRDEVLKRIGRESGSAASTRVEHYVESVFRDLALTYHHYELDTVASDQAVASSAVSLALPAGTYVVFGVLLKSNAGTEIGRLIHEEAGFLLGARTGTAEQPKKYTRFGSSIYFPSPTDAAYKADIYYYKTPDAADFAASETSPLDRLWDEHIIEGATIKALRGYWSADQAAPHAESLAEFLARVVNPPLAGGGMADPEDRPNVGRSHGGAQG